MHWSDFCIALGLALTFAGFGVEVVGLTAAMFYRLRRLLAASPLEFASLGGCCALAGFLLLMGIWIFLGSEDDR
jgi:hypothetical protein